MPSDKDVSVVERAFQKTDWIEASFGGATTALFGFATYLAAGDPFMGMSLSLIFLVLASATQSLRGDADAT